MTRPTVVPVVMLALAAGCLGPVVESGPMPEGGLEPGADAGQAATVDAGDCLLGTYAFHASSLPEERLVIAESTDGGGASWFSGGGYQCTWVNPQLGSRVRPCGSPSGQADAFWVQYDESGYVIADFSSFGCQADWSGTLIEMEVAGHPANTVTAHRE